MKRATIIYILLAFTSINLCAQDVQPFFKNYTWQENPVYKPGSGDQDICAVKDKIVTEFFFEGESFVEYFLEHRILWLNSDDQIENYNKIYLPYSQTSLLEISKARVIQKDGKVIELDSSKILTAEDEETGRKYKYFAFEGIEKGSFIEYYYVVKRNPSYRGKRLSLQASYAKRQLEFDLFAPSNLIFTFKSYNDIQQVKRDTILKDKNHWELRMSNLKGIDKESQSPYNASRGSVVYKLDKNTANNANNMVSYREISKNIYNYYHKELSKDGQKALQKFISDMQLTTISDQTEKIRKIDSYIKKNVYLSEGGGEGLDDMTSILTNKVANETGATKLFAAVFDALNIKHEIVITSDRLDLKFDKEFEAINFLNELLIYFPESKMYLAPGKFETRFGFPPAYFTDNYGLFIKEVAIGSYKSAVASIKYIDAVEAEKSADRMLIDVSFDTEDLTINTVKMNRSLAGYYAMYIQPFSYLFEGKKKDEMIEGFAKNLDANAEVTEAKMSNDTSELFGVEPLKIDVTFTSEAFVEKAGRKYLFKLGQIIGPQMEMYQEKKRVLPLESEYNRSYFRTINVKIPEGYKIANLSDINIDNSYSENGKEIFSFKSFYSLEGTTLKITADEHYRNTIVPPSIYEEYRKVINSAADFNKITLILEPK